MICPRCLSKAVYGPVWKKKRTLKSIHGKYEIEIDVMKCLDCSRWVHAENQYAPFGSRWDWKTINYILNSDEGHTELSRHIARRFGVHISVSTVHEIREKHVH